MFDYANDTGQIGFNKEPLIPHPDGKAWPKCCRGHVIDDKPPLDCAFIKNQNGGARLRVNDASRIMAYDGQCMAKVKNTPFICAHRSTDDGYHRVCAGWDACFGNKSLSAG